MYTQCGVGSITLSAIGAADAESLLCNICRRIKVYVLAPQQCTTQYLDLAASLAVIMCLYHDKGIPVLHSFYEQRIYIKLKHNINVNVLKLSISMSMFQNCQVEQPIW